MQDGKDYLQEIQKFATGQHWNSGVRITTGVIVPLLVMIHYGWLSTGIPFLFGSLFVSLSDTPGPIHHRRNGMLAAIALNSFMVIITAMGRNHQVVWFCEAVFFSFLLSLASVYGARAGAIGTLAIVIMVIHMSPLRQHQDILRSTMLIAGGGLWYALLSLSLYRLQPYRPAEQALGEHLMLIGRYIRARSGFYKKGSPIEVTYNDVMREQVNVLNAQTQLRELLFKTRQFVGDPSPRSRSIMMIFLESLDLFEETMYSYQDYSYLQKQAPVGILNDLHQSILKVAAALDTIGLSIQSGATLRKAPALSPSLDNLEMRIRQYKTTNAAAAGAMEGLFNTVQNIRGIVGRLNKIVLYSHMKMHDPERFPDQELEKPARTEPMTLNLLLENLTPRSNNFRYAARIAIAVAISFVVSVMFSLSHSYWVMFTAITILKPVYHLTRKRNIQRVAGTLAGVLWASALIFLIHNNTALVALMLICMLVAYSFLRVNYFTFVVFITTYILIAFHFLDPEKFRSLIGERLIDTIIGSVIAAFAARFIFPVWKQYEMEPVIRRMVETANKYLKATRNFLLSPSKYRREYNAARNNAIVALTNLSDNFQQMLSEPGASGKYVYTHQLVIASHALVSRISALSSKDLHDMEEINAWIQAASERLNDAAARLELSPGTSYH